MTSLHRQYTVYADDEGLVLQPEGTKAAAISIAYGTAAVETASPATAARASVYGIVGILDLVSAKYVVLITERKQVAEIGSKHVYSITDVACISLVSQAEAVATFDALKKRREPEQKVSGYDTDESDYIEDDLPAKNETPSTTAAAAVSSVASNVTQDVQRLGTFAQQWFSKGAAKPADPVTTTASATGKSASADAQAVEELEPETTNGAETAAGSGPSTIDTFRRRILKNTRLYYSSKSFFFSYDHDISRRWQDIETGPPSYKTFEQDFFWNRHPTESIAAAGHGQHILPLLQGFVGQRVFSLSSVTAKPQEYVITIISRRSTKRAGLRYLRRGVDEQGNVANCVETEQLLFAKDQSADTKTYSLVQLRGSIPLLFSQSPYSFKPTVQTRGSQEVNRTAFQKHFQTVQDRYGSIQVASLVDKHGTEASIGEAYEKTASWLNEQPGPHINFEWFDFHRVCKGMKFENVSVLLDTLEKSLTSFGWTTIQNGKALTSQSGVLRTNCMDCLDRTNVTQSSVAGRILQQQLKDLGLELDLRTDAKSLWFNQLWADNGDAISRQYAGTAALKGDFTRTRKRNWTGALSDFSLTLNRYYNNIFGDYFLQTCIDYLLGNVGPQVFNDFEASMVVKDDALDISRIRQNAIDVCIKIVIEAEEPLLGGWTLSCPSKANSLRSMPFEECVLLLTGAALYFCRFDWSTEKVGSFERIDLLDVKDIWRGPYITNALVASESDETRNVGFAFHYNTRGTATVRTNTRSMDNEKAASDQNAGKNELEKQAAPEKDGRRLLAFKMLHSSAFVSKMDNHDTDEDETVTARKISSAISEAIRAAMSKDQGSEVQLNVEEKPIIALSEAKKSTGYIDSISYSLKKLVW